MIKIRDGAGEVVSDGRLQPGEDSVLLAVGSGEETCLVEAGCRVKRFAGGETSVAAGSFETGTSPAGRCRMNGTVVATDGGTLYILDVGGRCIQKWSPGAVVGTAGDDDTGRGDGRLGFLPGLLPQARPSMCSMSVNVAL